MPFAISAAASIKLPHPVERNLCAYVLAAGAGLLAASPQADAQIVFTPAQQEIGLNQKMLIDFNHDGLTDLVISEVGFVSRFNSGNSLKAVPHSGGGVKQGYGKGFAQALSRGARIGPEAFFLRNRGIIEQTYSLYYRGSWLDAGNHYLGVRFPINGKMHYGWVRLSVTFGIAAFMSGFAYEAQPNTPINAGQTGAEQPEEFSSAVSSGRQSTDKVTLGTLALGARGLETWRATQR